MKFSFGDKHIESLYTNGHSKKHKYINKKLATIFVERVNRIEAAETIYDLRQPPSMHFESLEGHTNRFSIRINNKYRLEFEIRFEDKEQTKGEVKICTVSNHYK